MADAPNETLAGKQAVLEGDERPFKELAAERLNVAA